MSAYYFANFTWRWTQRTFQYLLLGWFAFGAWMGGFMVGLVPTVIVICNFGDALVGSLIARVLVVGSCVLGMIFAVRTWRNLWPKFIVETSPLTVTWDAAKVLPSKLTALFCKFILLSLKIIAMGTILAVGVALLYGAYVLLTLVSIPVAIVIGAVIIGLAFILALQ